MNNPSQTQISEAEERLRLAMLQNDVNVLDELIAPDLLFTGINGPFERSPTVNKFHELLSRRGDTGR